MKDILDLIYNNFGMLGVIASYFIIVFIIFFPIPALLWGWEDAMILTLIMMAFYGIRLLLVMIED